MGVRAMAIEDDPAVARLIGHALTAHGFEVVGTAGTGEEGIELANRLKPDVALVDLGLPRMSGEDVIARLRTEQPKMALIALTAVDIPVRVLAAIRAGANGYILKPFHAADLARAVQEVLSGEASPISPRAAKFLLAELRGDAPHQPAGGPQLSKRELEVLQLLVRGHTYGDVANALGIAEGTVQTYVKRIYEKLDVSSKAEAALLAVARGLVKP